MAYKSLVTFAATTEGLGAWLDTCAALAEQFDAHLEICALGVDLTQHMGIYPGAPAAIYTESLDAARATADSVAEAARAHLRGSTATLRWSIDTAMQSLGALHVHAGLKARYADLVVLPRPYGDGRGATDEVITESALFDGGAPVLIVPEAGATLRPFDKIVLAWDQSDEAMHATRAALPLLRDAREVNVVIIDPPVHGAERSDPGRRLTQMLARHGAEVEVSVLARSLPRTSDILRRHAIDQNADLLVMGAYGHSRLRQAILGGTTRAMLEETTLPVLMVH